MTEATASETSAPHLRALTGLRFFAAAWVVAYHFRTHIEPIWPWIDELEPWLGTGYLGVDLFFILSGFIITYNYAARLAHPSWATYRYFLGLRLARMYPVHLFTLLALAALVAAAALAQRDLSGDYSAASFLRHLTLTSVWGPPTEFSWNYPAWSISAEWAAYLAFPVLAVALRKVTGLGQYVVLAVAVFGGYVALLEAGVTNHPLLRIAFEFTLGAMLCGVFRRLRPHRRWDWVALAAVVAIANAVTLDDELRFYLLVALFAILVLALALAFGGVNRALSTPQLVFLGEASYSLYMTHALVEMVGSNLLPIEEQVGSSLLVQLAVLALYVVALAAAAIGTYLIVERPARDKWRSRLRRPQPTTVRPG